jgi:hypothetical protein
MIDTNLLPTVENPNRGAPCPRSTKAHQRGERRERDRGVIGGGLTNVIYKRKGVYVDPDHTSHFT